MAVDRSHVADNTTQRQRLQTLVQRLSDDDLRRTLPSGWTIAGLLAHIAFWDQRAALLLEQWERDRATAQPRPIDQADVHWINNAAKPFLLALPPRRAAELAVAFAETTDRRIAALSDDDVAHNAAAGHPVNLLRAQHRRQHLDEIELALHG
jgi:hypothetical protein